MDADRGDLMQACARIEGFLRKERQYYGEYYGW
jgi:hypothetical protein